MTGRFERTLALLAIAAEIALGATVVAPVRGEAAVVICQRGSKLKLRLDACKSKETRVDAGELGATGPAGPPGPGTLMSSSSTTATTIIGPPCTNYLQVTITVPSSGTVLVQAQVWVAIDHTFGTRDLANLRIADAPGSCGLSPYTSPVDVPADAPTATSFSGVFLQTPFPVTAGTYTFYFNGFMGVGQNSLDNFYYGNMVAVFYPS